jgi:hypothetical protein
MSVNEEDAGFGKKGCRDRKEMMGGPENEKTFNPT